MSDRPREMSIKEHLIMTVVVLALIGFFLFAGGCTQVTHSSDPSFTYPKGLTND